jgi:hypothetical protein
VILIDGWRGLGPFVNCECRMPNAELMPNEEPISAFGIRHSQLTEGREVNPSLYRGNAKA